MEAQWAACEEAFIDALPDKEGMPVERYERIKDVLARWDDLSPAERRELSGGNQAYWYKKYSYMATEDGEGEVLILPGEVVDVDGDDDDEEGAPASKPSKRAAQLCVLSHQGRFFEDIKAVHLASVLALMLAPSACFSSHGACVCIVCGRVPLQGCGAVQGRVRTARPIDPAIDRAPLCQALPGLHSDGAWQLPLCPSPLRRASPSRPLLSFISHAVPLCRCRRSERRRLLASGPS